MISPQSNQLLVFIDQVKTHQLSAVFSELLARKLYSFSNAQNLMSDEAGTSSHIQTFCGGKFCRNVQIRPDVPKIFPIPKKRVNSTPKGLKEKPNALAKGTYLKALENMHTSFHAYY